MSQQNQPNITRRNFLRAASTLVALGTVEFLPKVDGGFLEPASDFVHPKVAYADDSEFVITVVSKQEVGINVVDVTNGADTPVQGATVTITSRFNKKSVSAVTGEGFTDPGDYGKVILNIADLAERDSDGNLLNDGTYAFNGSVSVKAPASRSAQLRDFATGKMRIEGASGLRLGTQLVGDATVYPVVLSFDEWDAHYLDCTFYRSQINTRPHQFMIGLTGTTADVPVTLCKRDDKNWPEKGGLTATATYNENTGLVEAVFEKEWLCKDGAYCPTDDQTILRFIYGDGYYTDVTFNLEDASITSPLDNNPTIVPMFPKGKNPFKYTFSDDAPKIFKNSSISVWTPEIPVTFCYTPGNYMLGVTIGRYTPKLDNGNPDNKAVADAPKEPLSAKIKDYFQKQYNEIKAAVVNHAYIDKETGGLTKNRLTKDLDISVSFQFVLHCVKQSIIENDQGVKLHYFTGSGFFGGALNVNAGFTEQFMISVVPVFISFAIDFNAQCGFEVLATKTVDPNASDIELVDVDWNLNDVQPIVINLRLAFTLSVGAGIKGVACIAIAGTVSISTYLSIVSATSDKANPHVIVGVAFVAEIYIQALVFKGSKTIWQVDDKNAFNNWSSSVSAESSEDAWAGHKRRFQLDDGNMAVSTEGQVLLGSDDPYGNMVIVSQDDLARSAEFGAYSVSQEGSAGGNSNSSDALPTMYENKALRYIRQDDGTYAVMLVPCDGVNTFALDTVPVYGEQATVADSESDDAIVQADSSDGNIEEDTSTDVSAEGLTANAFLGFGMRAQAAYQYVPTREVVARRCTMLGIDGLGPHGGVKPKTDVVINSGVFSDPRQRVVEIQGNLYLFRILTVTYPGNNTRTRLSASQFNEGDQTWSTPTVLEYTCDAEGIDRIDIFDYDFDVITSPSGTTWYDGSVACVVLTGGTRPNGDDTTITTAFANPLITVLLIDGSLGVIYSSVCRPTTYLNNTDPYHAVCTPHVVDRFTPDGSTGGILFSFLHRSSDSVDKLMTSDATVSFTLGYTTLISTAMSSFETYTWPSAIDSNAFDLNLVLGNVPSDNPDVEPTRYATVLVMYPQGYDVYSGQMPEVGGLSGFSMQCNIHSTDALPNIVPWQGHSAFLYAKKGSDMGSGASDEGSASFIVAGTYDPTWVNQSGFEEKVINPDGFKGGAFTVSSTGSYLFFIENRDGWCGDDIDTETGKATPVTDELYRIKASKYLEETGAFCEDFPFCELNHPIDSLEPLTISEEASSFVCVQVTDANHSLAQLHYISVPHAVATEVVGFAVEDDFACAGKSCSFAVTVKNHGNVVITGFTVALKDGDTGKVVSTATVGQIEPDSISLGVADYKWAAVQGGAPEPEGGAHQLSDALKDGQLPPGKPVTYSVSFSVPADWSGEKKVLVGVTEAYANMEALFAEAEAESGVVRAEASDVGITHVEYHEPGVEGNVMVRGANEYNNPTMPNEGRLTTDGNDAGGNTVGDPKSSTAGPGTTRKQTPGTGDPTSGVGPAALALGGLGALFAGYSKRRTDLEQK